MAVDSLQSTVQQLATNWQKVEHQQPDGGLLIDKQGKLIGEAEFGTFTGKFIKALVRVGIAREGNLGGRIAVAVVGQDAFAALNMSMTQRKENSVRNVLALINNVRYTGRDGDLATAARDEINSQFPTSRKVASGIQRREINKGQIDRLGSALDTLQQEVIPQRLAQRQSNLDRIHTGKPTPVMKQASSSALKLALRGLDEGVDKHFGPEGMKEQLDAMDRGSPTLGARGASGQAEQLIRDYKAMSFQVRSDLESQINELEEEMSMLGPDADFLDNDRETQLRGLQTELDKAEGDLRDQYIERLTKTLDNSIDSTLKGEPSTAMLKASESGLLFALRGFEETVDKLPSAQMSGRLYTMSREEEKFGLITSGQGEVRFQADQLIKDYQVARDRVCGDLETRINNLQQQIGEEQQAPEPGRTDRMQGQVEQLKEQLRRTEDEFRGQYINTLTQARETVKAQDGRHMREDGRLMRPGTTGDENVKLDPSRQNAPEAGGDGTKSAQRKGVLLDSSGNVQASAASFSNTSAGWADEFKASLAQAAKDLRAEQGQEAEQGQAVTGEDGKVTGKQALFNLARSLTEVINNPATSDEDKRTAHVLRQSEEFRGDFECLGEVLGSFDAKLSDNNRKANADWKKMCADPATLQLYRADTAPLKALLDAKEREAIAAIANPNEHPDFQGYVEVFGSEEGARAEIVEEAGSDKTDVSTLRGRISDLDRALANTPKASEVELASDLEAEFDRRMSASSLAPNSP